MVFWWWWWCSGYLHPLVFSWKIWLISSLSIPRLIDAYSNNAYSNDVYSNIFLLSMFIRYDITCWAICAHSLLNISVKDETTESSGKDKGKAKMNWWHTALYVKVFIYISAIDVWWNVAFYTLRLRMLCLF